MRHVKLDMALVGLPPEAREAALVLLSSVSIESTANVLFSGPVEPGTVVRENSISEDRVELQVPDTPGTYYVFFFDEHPEGMFAHPVRYAWVNLDTDEVEYVDASYLMTIYPPDKEPSPFIKVGNGEVNGIPFNLYEGEGAPEPKDVSHKQVVETFNASDIGVSIIRHSRRESLKIASVIDCGDGNAIFNSRREFAERNADPMGKWLKDNGFNVQRISQYSGNDLPRFEKKFDAMVADPFLNYIDSFGIFFKSIGPPDEYCDEFFLYLSAHGKEKDSTGGFQLYPADGTFSQADVPWITFLQLGFKNFPKWVKVTIFADNCYSGRLIAENDALLKNLSNQVCVITIMTSTDKDKWGLAPSVGWHSATEDFLSGGYVDYDQDGINGDIYDRFMVMKNVMFNRNPQSYHEPSGESWCSLDGSQTAWDEPPPVAEAGNDQVADIGTTVQLDGSNSYDPEDYLLFYKWTFKSKPDGSNAVLSADDVVNPTFVLDVPGTYTVELIVNDENLDSEPSTVTITATGYPSNYTNTIGQKFVLIPAGMFTMGSPGDEPGREMWGGDETQHQVTLTQPFYMMTTEVTQGQWKAVMGANPSGSNICDNCPVERVSWYDAQAFIQALNTLEGTDKYRLPTEAEWEYACRAGSTTAFANGDITELGYSTPDPNLVKIGWYLYDSSATETHVVAQKDPNAWGLYDMHGNVEEWCQDWSDNYPTDPVTDPTGPESGTERIRRGGSWDENSEGCRSAWRDGVRPTILSTETGFRLASTP